MGDECNCLMVSTFFSTTLLGNRDEDLRIDLFQSCGPSGSSRLAVIKTLTVSSFRDLNSSAGISSHSLALLTAGLKAHLIRTPERLVLGD